MSLNIPENLDHLDQLSPEQLMSLILRKILIPLNGHLKIIRECINAGANIHDCDDRHGTVLHMAAVARRSDVIEILIKAGADLDARNAGGSTALHISVGRHDLQSIQLLLNGGALKDIKNVSGRTPWDISSQPLRAKCPELNPSYENLDQLSPEKLGYIFVRELEKKVPSLPFIKALIAAGLDVNAGYHNANGAFHESMRDKYTQLIISSKGVLEITAPNTPLHWAVFYRHHEIIKLLLDAGASKDVLNNHNRTPWDLAGEIIRTQCPELQP